MTAPAVQPGYHISPHDNWPGRSYRINDPSGEFIAEVWPERNYEVVLTIKPHTQYEWYLINQRVLTLVAAARVAEKSEGRPSPNAVCHACGFEADESTPYGWRCEWLGGSGTDCQGTLFMPGTFPEKETP